MRFAALCADVSFIFSTVIVALRQSVITSVTIGQYNSRTSFCKHVSELRLDLCLNNLRNQIQHIVFGQETDLLASASAGQETASRFSFQLQRLAVSCPASAFCQHLCFLPSKMCCICSLFCRDLFIQEIFK